MKKRFLYLINFILGSLSLTLAGCHSVKEAPAAQRLDRPMVKYGVPTEVIAMYGVQLPDGYDIPEVPQVPAAPVDTLANDSVASDSAEQHAQPQDFIIVKYGIPGSF